MAWSCKDVEVFILFIVCSFCSFVFCPSVLRLRANCLIFSIRDFAYTDTSENSVQNGQPKLGNFRRTGRRTTLALCWERRALSRNHAIWVDVDPHLLFPQERENHL